MKTGKRYDINNAGDACSDKSEEGANKILQRVLSDRYIIVSELARGSDSIVYLVRHQMLGEYRAVKCISKRPDSVWQIREAEILNHLKHPQIPVIYDIEEDEESYYIIEEYVEGQSLEAVMLQSSFITLDFIYHTMLELADILMYLHQQTPAPIIYQDLKPEHIIVGKAGIKLIDFGIAVCLGEEGNKFQNYGTPGFCAPEKKKGAKVSQKTDIYSMGKLLEALILRDTSGESQCLMHIAKHAMHAREEQRYESVKTMAEAMIRTMQSQKNSVYQKHLLKKIVVAGSQPHIGATHVAVACTVYLNHQGFFAVYQEKNSSQDMRVTIRKGGFTEEGGLFRRRNFLGMPEYGEGVAVDAPPEAVKIMDYGTDIERALSEEPDLFLLVGGCRSWEISNMEQTYSKARDCKNLVLLANYGDFHQAKQYAADYGRTVYSFPLDSDPFLITKEKNRLFGQLLKREGGQDKGRKKKCHWYRRKCSGSGCHSSCRGVGKLLGKRIR